MRIMSYNIHSGKDADNVLDMNGIIEVIRKLAPAVCALNEVRMGTTDVKGAYLAKDAGEALKMEWRFGRAIDIAGGEYGNAILSKYPITASRVVPVPEVPAERREKRYEPRCVLECDVAAPMGELRVLTCHFGLSDEEARLACDTVLALLAEDARPAVFMGDLNLQPDSPIIARLRTALTDTGDMLPLTFNAKAPTIKIDYIMSRGLSLGRLQTYATTASDHLPVFADEE